MEEGRGGMGLVWGSGTNGSERQRPRHHELDDELCAYQEPDTRIGKSQKGVKVHEAGSLLPFYVLLNVW